jgi:hypothetical protein
MAQIQERPREVDTPRDRDYDELRREIDRLRETQERLVAVLEFDHDLDMLLRQDHT